MGGVSSWALTAMQWANAEGLINGTSGTTLSPTNGATRAEVAQILMRFCENFVD
ncbi:S-layer homology domain-containing protein [Flavonifractor plautii]|uniref:S-layer homology domain-containing protein n=1 Tax=Flavonifractor plautii TaxID=292800 RepID=UPI001D099E64|nr:S-layer homology domain-containing protein [Flavonifractor plautii]